MKEIQNMKKLFFTLLTFCSVMIWAGEAEIGKTVAHSVADWDAAGNGVTPEQGFRNWYFGYYDQVDKPETFQLIPQKGKQYWGDGNFTCGMISRDTIAWAGGSQKHNVVRRWVAPEDGNYLAEMEGTHTLKVKGELVTWPRKLYIYVNSKLRQTFSFPGKTVRKEAFAATLKKEDKLDFVSDAWGGGLRITIVINKQEKGLPVAVNGSSPYQIVIPDSDPGTIAMKAAGLLQRVLKESTAAEFPVVREAQAADKPSFYIGNTRKAAAEGLDPAKLQEHEYVRKVSGQNVFLIGVNSETEVRGKKAYRQGDYKAVCSFLENELGARFLLPGKQGEFIPKRNVFIIPADLNEKHTPPFKYHITSHTIKIQRDAYEPYMTASNFIDRNDLRYFYGHSWQPAVPGSKYAETHPEYFVMLGGKRHPEAIGNQLCIGNKEVQELIKKHIEDSFKDGYSMYQLSQSDGFQSCECPECKTMGTPSERVWKFHRAVAEEINRKCPDGKINILAYDITQEPPVWFDSFPKNVVVELTKYDEKEFQKWQKYNVPLMVYSYNWGNYHELGFLPKRTPKRVAEQLARFKKYNVLNIFDCGYPDAFNGLEAPTVYVYSKLLDDLSLNPELLAEDYCRASFGDAAGPVMYNFFSAMHKYLESYSENAYFTDDDRTLIRNPEVMIATHFPPSAITFMEECLEKAEKQVTTENEKLRLLNVRLHFNYLQSMVKTLCTYRSFQMTPSTLTFKMVCDGLRERENAIDAICGAKLPPQWRVRANKEAYLAGGSLSGKLGAPFTWNYKEMEKSGKIPLVKCKEAVVVRVAQAPLIDGSLSDKVWDSLPEYPLEKVSGGAADIPSSFKIAYDDRNIYIGFKAEVPQIAKESYKSVGHDHYISSECFDVLLNPTGLADRYYQFIFSPAENSALDGSMNIGRHGADPQWNKLDTLWNGNWKYAFKIDPAHDCWTAVLVVPVDSLGGFKPAPGKSMTLNIGRVHKNKLYLWSPNPENQMFGNVLCFGNILFR